MVPCRAPTLETALPDHDQPLTGVRILDFTQNLPGPYATSVLRAMGAEVVKVEPPTGDAARAIEPFFSMLNRGKQSVVLDLRDPSSAAPLRALVEWADVLVEGFRPGVMGRLGCNAATARTWNPRLVYVSISAWGQSGPRVRQPAHDLNTQALTGLCHLERDRRGVPRGTTLPLADLSTAMNAVASICAALAARGAEGPGTTLDIAMSDALLSWVHVWGEGVDLAGQARRVLDKQGTLMSAVGQRLLVGELERRKLYALPQYSTYRAGDGQWLTLGIVGERHFWRALCGALNLGPAARIPMPVLGALSPLMRRLIAMRLRRRPRAHWLKVLAEAGVPAAAVLTRDEAQAEPQFRQRGLVDAGGQVLAAVAQARHVDEPPPALGQHTDEITARLRVSAPAQNGVVE